MRSYFQVPYIRYIIPVNLPHVKSLCFLLPSHASVSVRSIARGVSNMKDFTRPPLKVALTWPEPNYVNPEKNGEYLAPATIVLTSITVLIVLGRLWSRAVITRQFGPDDWSVSLAMVGSPIMKFRWRRLISMLGLCSWLLITRHLPYDIQKPLDVLQADTFARGIGL